MAEEKKEEKKDPLAEAKATIKDLQETVIEAKKTIAELEAARTQEIMAGGSKSGQGQKPVEETPKEYKNRIMAGK